MDIGYLNYLERSADTSLSGAALLHLADALGTTAAALVGGQVDRPSGEGRAGPHPKLEAMSREDCEAHLVAGGVGRVVFSTQRGPVALPVNFVSVNGHVIFRTDDSMASAIEFEETVGFEVDHIDEAMSGGWSVLATGTPYRVIDPKACQEIASLEIEPWAGGTRDVFIWIAIDELTGRAIVQSESVVR
jgi:nitroimidazol reductase NimA-like FMN-containing flavoprotein (pyridoxamine 5'-phosphate oxidase superfamily)